MTYSLDANTCIRYLNGRSPNIIAKIQNMPAGEIAVCSIVRAELFYGSSKSTTPEKSRAQQDKFLGPYRTLPFDHAAANIYGTIRASLEKRGLIIGPNDLIIAAITLANNLTLVTHNVTEFSRVDGLKIEDWEV